MKRIVKLTPKVIKRIIAEEREKIENEKKSKLLEQLRLLKKIKNKQCLNKEVQLLNLLQHQTRVRVQEEMQI
jgi:hypothetical protein